MFGREVVAGTDLPAISTGLTLAESRHRFIGAARLSLTVRDLLLTTLATGEAGGNASLGLGYHRVLHVRSLELLVLGTALRRLQLLVGHVDQTFGGDLAEQDALAEFRVRLGLEVVEQRAQLGLVVARVLAAVFAHGGAFDVDGALEDEGRDWRCVGDAVFYLQSWKVFDGRAKPTFVNHKGQSVIE